MRLKDAGVAETVVVEGVRDQKTTPGLEQYLEQLRTVLPAVVDDVARLLGRLQELGTFVEVLASGIAVGFSDPHGSRQDFRLLRGFERLKSQLRTRGYDTQIALDYAGTIAQWFPDTRVDAESGNLVGPDGRDVEPPISILATVRQREYVELVKTVLDRLRTEPRPEAASQRVTNSASR